MQYILSHWPLAFICLAMILAAVIDGWKLKVPNWLTFPLVITGWLLGLVNDLGWLPADMAYGGIGASLAGTALGFALLFPIWAIGGMGAGDVKMQMGFGAWIGSFYGLNSHQHGGALWIVFSAFCLAAVIGGFLAAIMMLVRGQWNKNVSNTRAILGDLLGAKGVEEVADKAATRKPTMHLLPYGIPLCLGFISYLIYLHGI